MSIALVFMAFGWYSVIGKRRASPINTDGTILSPDGSAGFTTDGSTLLSVY